ncbi:MAG: GAF domain-containing protein [Bacteroidales bacterium]
MKLKISFTFKILLPYLVTGALFLLIFLSELGAGHSPVIWLSAGGLLASLVLAVLHHRWLGLPFRKTRNLMQQLTRGSLPRIEPSGSVNGTGDLEKNLETHASHLREIASFARSLASGDYAASLKKAGSEDELGESLLSLKKSLMKSLEESESRRREEEHQTWAARGIAKFSTLFREAEDNLYDLAGLLIRELVGYTEADVGALFIVSDREEGRGQVLEMYGSYAFDREKYIQRSFEMGEGLVGRTALEKEPVYITDLPPDYIRIRSGLGEEAPCSLLLVPVLLDNQVLGIIELASLGEIPPHQRAFIRQLGEVLATALAKVKANLQTRILLEQTKQQTEKFATREKVYAQQVEQLQRNLEESDQREAELRKEIEILKSKAGEGPAERKY